MAGDPEDPESHEQTLAAMQAGPATPASGPLLFRRYRVVRELGRGGMGVVMLAQDTALDIPVAVKVVPETVVKDTESVSDLRKEVLRGMALAHPGIVRTHNFDRDESGAGIIMEYVDGETLTDLKQKQPGGCFNPEQILPWVEQLCAVLDYAHGDAHIVHRDLKPRNIMLTQAGRVKVADFGIAAILSDSMSRHSMEGRVSGTLSYMSPQQVEGKRPSHLDDIHALGATVYELLTGKPPFFRGNQASIFQQVLAVIPPSIMERREDLEVMGKPAIPKLWEATVAACLAKDPAMRPQSAGEVARLLAAGLHGAAAPAPAPSRSGSRAGAGWGGRIPWVIGSAAVVLAGLVAVAALIFGGGETERTASAPQVAPATPLPLVIASTPVPQPQPVAAAPAPAPAPVATPAPVPQATPAPVPTVAPTVAMAQSEPPAPADSWGRYAGTYHGPASTTVKFKQGLDPFRSTGKATLVLDGTRAQPDVSIVFEMHDSLGNAATQIYSTATGGKARAEGESVILTGGYRFGASTRNYELKIRLSDDRAAVSMRDSNIYDESSGSFTLEKQE